MGSRKKPEPKKPAGKRPVDKGNVVALHKAGWTVKNIAEDEISLTVIRKSDGKKEELIK